MVGSYYVLLGWFKRYLGCGITMVRKVFVAGITKKLGYQGAIRGPNRFFWNVNYACQSREPFGPAT